MAESSLSCAHTVSSEDTSFVAYTAYFWDVKQLLELLSDLLHVGEGARRFRIFLVRKVADAFDRL